MKNISPFVEHLKQCKNNPNLVIQKCSKEELPHFLARWIYKRKTPAKNFQPPIISQSLAFLILTLSVGTGNVEFALASFSVI